MTTKKKHTRKLLTKQDKSSILKPVKRNKFGAKRTTVDGHNFHSKREAARYGELKILLRTGNIKELELQPKYDLFTVGEAGEAIKVGTYSADFRYLVPGSNSGLLGWVSVVEDVKSNPTRTSLYRLKKRMVEATYGIEIIEVA